MGGILLDCLILMPLLLWWRMVWEEWWLHSLAWRRTGSTQPQYMYSIMEEWYSSHNQWRSVSVCCMYHVSHYLYCLSEGTYDAQNVTLSFDDGGQLCITVLYARGSKSQQSTMKLVCSSAIHCCYHQLAMINGTDWCFNNLPASGSCNISVTDLDAVDSIDATPAVKYTDIIIVGPSSATSSVHHTATTASLNTDMTIPLLSIPTETPTGLWLYKWTS